MAEGRYRLQKFGMMGLALFETNAQQRETIYESIYTILSNFEPNEYVHFFKIPNTLA
jgi:hypothetical protein